MTSRLSLFLVALALVVAAPTAPEAIGAKSSGVLGVCCRLNRPAAIR